MTKSTPNSWSIRLIVILLLLCIAAVLAMASVPPVNRDALTHHLALPKLWIEKGEIHAIPHLKFSYYPMNLELLYAVPMIFGNDIFPKYIHFLFALGTAWLIYTYLRPRTTKFLSLFGALLFLSTPIVIKLSISAYVDLGLVFFSWAALMHLFSWKRNTRSIKHLIMSAIFCGLGLGTKYNGMVSLMLITFIVPMVYVHSIRENQRKSILAIGYPILFVLIALTMFSPWMIRNFRLTGNPIYPLYNSQILSIEKRSEISNLTMKPWLQRKLIYRESAAATALIPIRVFFQGEDDNPRYFDGKLNPIFVFFPLLLLVGRKRRNPRLSFEYKLLIVYVVLFILYASFMVDMRIRYILPTIPALTVLTVAGIDAAWRWAHDAGKGGMQRICRGIVICVTAGFFCLNLHYMVGVFQSVNPGPYIVGTVSRTDYLKRKLPEFEAIQFTNEIPGEETKIMAMFVGNRLYYFEKPVEFLLRRFADMVAESSNASSLAASIHQKGFSHCLIGTQHFEAWINQSFSNDQRMIVSQWLKNDCKLLFSKNGYAVFKLCL